MIPTTTSFMIKEELKRIKFIDNSFKFMEENYINKEFHGASKYGETINQFYSIEEKSQIGVQLSAKLFSAFYSYLKYETNIFLEKNNSFLRVITDRNIHITESYDLLLMDIRNNEISKFEIKLSQNKNSWQGSTSSTSKVDNYILINFEIDRDLPLNDGSNYGFFKSVFACIVDLKNHSWSGQAKSNNHRTKFEFRMDDWDIDILKNNCIIKGDVKEAKSIYHIVRTVPEYE
jgi:hypothetical protein